MNVLDAVEMLAAISRRCAIVIFVALVVGMIWFRPETTNLVYGQALDSAVGLTSIVATAWDLHCTVTQDGLLAPATVDCTTAS